MVNIIKQEIEQSPEMYFYLTNCFGDNLDGTYNKKVVKSSEDYFEKVFTNLRIFIDDIRKMDKPEVRGETEKIIYTLPLDLKMISVYYLLYNYSSCDIATQFGLDEEEVKTRLKKGIILLEEMCIKMKVSFPNNARLLKWLYYII